MDRRTRRQMQTGIVVVGIGAAAQIVLVIGLVAGWWH